MSPAAKSKLKDILAAKAGKEQAKVSSKPSVALPSYGNGAPSNAYNPDSGTFLNFDATAAKAGKEQAKVSSKPSVALPSYGNGAPSNAYNPDSGTFLNFDATASSSLPMSQHNSRFGTIDETEENSVSSFGTTGDLDSLSSQGELEELEKKTSTSSTSRLESASGCDTDKREKIRQKNERKHQRQKERRALELHERCSGYLMSRKLEMLAQKIVAMGFSSEEATMALIQNEGRVEESIAWLLELSEESKQQFVANGDGSVNLKIDISMELARITEIEMKFKCTKQEVERAVVASEGDLDKAEEILKAQKQVCKGTSSKSEETGDPVTASSLESKMLMPGAVPGAALRPQQNGLISVGTQQKRGERDLNYIKSLATGVGESSNKNFQSLRKVQAKSEWARPQSAAPVDRRWPSASSSPSISHPLASPLQVAVAPINGYVMAGNEAKANLPSVALREPVVVMQRPQSVNAKQYAVSTCLDISVSSPASTGWCPNGMSTIEVMKVENGVGLRHSSPHLGIKGSTPQQYASLNHFRNAASSTMESLASGWGSSRNPTVSPTSSLTAPSSLGLFTGWGSSETASSLLDWSSGGSTPCDYTSIDWSLDTTLLRPSAKSDHLSSTWSTMFMGGKSTGPIVNTGGGICISSLQDTGLAADPSYSSASNEWSSPFAGRDLFSVPRQYINSSF